MDKKRFDHIEIRVGSNGYVVYEGPIHSSAPMPNPYVFETVGALQGWLEDRLKVPADPYER